MGAPGRPARRLSAALAAFLLLTLAGTLAPQAAQAQQTCGSLSAPTVTTSSGAKRLTVNWGALSTGQSLVGSWELQWRKTGASNWNTRTISGANIRSAEISGLDDGTTYQVRLRANHQTGTCPPGGISTIATGSTPYAPVLTVTPGDGQVRLSWTWTRGRSGLPASWVYRQKQGSGNYGGWLVMTGGGSARSFTVTGLNNGTAYTFQIARRSTSPPNAPPPIFLPYSNEVAATPTDVTTPAPVLTEATSTSLTSGSKIDLTWTHAGTGASDFVSGAATFDHWQASHRLKGDTNWTVWSNRSQALGTSRRTVTFVTGDRYPNGAVVQVRVRATGTASDNAAVQGPWSNVREVTYKNDDLNALTIVGVPVTVTQGSTKTYTVALTKAYAGTLRIASGATGKATVDPATLTFTAGNYNTAQTVTVTGVGAGQATIAHAFRLTGASADAIPDAGTVSVTVTPVAAPPPILISDPDKSVTLPPGDSTVLVCYNLQAVSYDGTTYLETRPGQTTVSAHASLRHATNGVEITAAPTGITTGRNVNLNPCANLGVGRHTVTWEWNGPDGTASKEGTTSTTATVVNAASPVLTATAGDGQVTLNWTWSGSASGLAGWRFSRSGRSGWSLISGSNASTRSYTVTGLDNGTAYTFGVWGIDADGVIVAGTNSNLVTATPMAPAPAAPTGFTATAGNGQVTLSWSDPGDATITGYKYQRRKGSFAWSAWVPIEGSDASTTSNTFTGLDNGIEYRYRIRAVNAAGDGAQSVVKRVMPMAVVPAPPPRPASRRRRATAR